MGTTSKIYMKYHFYLMINCILSFILFFTVDRRRYINMNIMVTGANGGYGSLAIGYLQKLAPNANIYGLVRSEAKGVALKEKGIQIRIGDYADFDSMKKALSGIDRLLFVSSPIPGIQKNVVDAAVANDVKYIAYTGIFFSLNIQNLAWRLTINRLKNGLRSQELLIQF